jgi:hypothetical protein
MNEHTKQVPREGTGCGCGCGGPACPSCRGLVASERPRYFAGQLLTEDDLRAEQEYMLAKNRLHNRFLHGWGVVCGLELGCGDCPGFVTVRPGYAIDPCGNDIVLPCRQQLDVLAAIRACQDARRRRRPDCDPYQPPADTSCDDVSEHWCVTLRYGEQQRRPTTALRHGAGNGGGDCGGGCGGGCGAGCGGSCGNGNGNGNGHNGHNGRNGRNGVSTRPAALGACEPTRVLETFRLGVARQCEDSCPPPTDALRRTFLGNVVTCIQVLGERMSKRLNTKDRQIVLALAFQQPDENFSWSAEEVYEALCRLRQAVREVLEDERLPVHCMRLRDLDATTIPKPGDETGQQYADRTRQSVEALAALLSDHVRDCICHALMPPCPEDPCDDRVILGCVEVRDGEIVEVCGWSGRRYAGSFSALAYWLSIGPALAWAICKLCCSPRFAGRYAGRLRLNALLDGVDPSGSLRRSIYADDFAMPRTRFAGLRRLLMRLHPQQWSSLVESDSPKDIRVATDGPPKAGDR